MFGLHLDAHLPSQEAAERLPHARLVDDWLAPGSCFAPRPWQPKRAPGSQANSSTALVFDPLFLLSQSSIHCSCFHQSVSGIDFQPNNPSLDLPDQIKTIYFPDYLQTLFFFRHKTDGTDQTSHYSSHRSSTRGRI